MDTQQKQEIITQAAKAVPAIAGTTVASLTLNEWVAVATFIYVVIQIAFLIWRWVKEANKIE